MTERFKRWVFRRFLKTDIDDADVTFCGAECSTVG